MNRTSDTTSLNRNGEVSSSLNSAQNFVPHHRQETHRGDLGERILSASQYSAVAACATISAKTLLHPLDTVKTRFQAIPHGSLTPFKQLWTVRGLYRGYAIKMIVSAPSQSIYMISYQFFRNLTEKQLGHTASYLIGAIAAELSAAIIRVPGAVAKVRLQADVFHNLADVAKYMRSNPRDVYSFFWVQTCVHDIPYSMIQWVLFEKIRQSIFHNKNKNRLSAAESSALAATSSAVTATLTCPLDVVRIRLMVQQGQATTLATTASASASASASTATPKIGNTHYVSIPNCFSRIFREEGPRAFFRGLVPRITWVSSSMGVYFFFLEIYKDVVLKYYNPDWHMKN